MELLNFANAALFHNKMDTKSSEIKLAMKLVLGDFLW